jgi:hypothetical protein
VILNLYVPVPWVSLALAAWQLVSSGSDIHGQPSRTPPPRRS